MKIFLLLVIITSAGCGSSSFIKNIQQSSSVKKSTPPIGALGIIKLKFLNKEFVSRGAPVINDPLRLSYQMKPLNKSDSLKIMRQPKSPLDLKDTIAKRYFFEFRVADEVGMYAAINSKVNKELLLFLQDSPRNQILYQEDLFFNKDLSRKILNAIDLFLIQDSMGLYYLKIIKTDHSFELIDWSEGVLLGFESRKFCWKKNFRGDIQLAGFRKTGESCERGTKNNPKKIQQRDAFDKI